MELVSLGPLPATALVWRPSPSVHGLTLIVKATYELRPIESPLSSKQEPPNEEDNHWNDDPGRSLYAPSDLAPFKPRAEVMLVGHAFVPGAAPSRSVRAQLVVGELDKSIEVFCDRKLSFDGRLIDGPRFHKMPLRYERAAGGLDTANPVGMRFDATDAVGATMIPNLQPIGASFSARGDVFAPVGFGPIAPSWPTRARKLGRNGGGFSREGLRVAPMPEDFDYGFFQAAPADQQLDALRPNERIVLEHLHPEHARLVTSLPGVHPRARVERAGGQEEEIVMVADTLWIDTDRAICTLVFRGRIGLRHPDEAGRIVVTTERFGGASVEGGVELDDAEIGGATVTIQGGNARSLASAVMPFSGGASQPLPRVDGPRVGEGLPFVRSAPSVPSAMPAPPAFVPPPPPAASPLPSSPWVSGDRVAEAKSIGQIVAAAPAPVSASAAPPTDVERAKTVPDKPAAPLVDARAGAASASNAAARAERGRALRAALVRHSVELLWWNAGSMGRIRKHAGFKDLLSEVKPRPEDEDLDDDVPAPRRIPAKDRRELLSILSRGEPLDVMGVEDAFYLAMEEEGGFTPPLMLVAGMLEMQFDELEVLKATLAAVAPHVSGEKRLEDAVGRVHDAMKMPWTQGANGVLDAMAAEVRRVFLESRKGLAGDMLDPMVERTLVEQRHYRKRTVFGQARIVGSLSSAGQAEKVPVYLPEAAGKELPGFRRMNVRMIGEVRPRAEQGEAAEVAVRGMVVGRVLGGSVQVV